MGISHTATDPPTRIRNGGFVVSNFGIRTCFLQEQAKKSRSEYAKRFAGANIEHHVIAFDEKEINKIHIFSSKELNIQTPIGG